eukprot:1682333-Rhodomonas_salina.2
MPCSAAPQPHASATSSVLICAARGHAPAAAGASVWLRRVRNLGGGGAGGEEGDDRRVGGVVEAERSVRKALRRPPLPSRPALQHRPAPRASARTLQRSTTMHNTGEGGGYRRLWGRVRGEHDGQPVVLLVKLGGEIRTHVAVGGNVGRHRHQRRLAKAQPARKLLRVLPVPVLHGLEEDAPSDCVETEPQRGNAGPSVGLVTHADRRLLELKLHYRLRAERGHAFGQEESQGRKADGPRESKPDQRPPCLYA